jgi:hypothetical protein
MLLIPRLSAGIGMALSMFQFVGINVIFTTTAFYGGQSGSRKDSLWITVITRATNIVTTLIAITLWISLVANPCSLWGRLAGIELEDI